MERVVIGISGATGVYAGLNAIVQTMLGGTHFPDVVTSKGFEEVLEHELTDDFVFNFFHEWGFIQGSDPILDWSFSTAENLVGRRIDEFNPHFYMEDMASEIASGSYETCGMIVLPCSMNTLSAIATGRSDSLLTRAADVTLKENRPLVLCIRETPLSKIHIDNMKRSADAGATIMPVCLPLYLRTLEYPTADFINKYVSRALKQLGIKTLEFESYKPKEVVK